MNNLFKDKDTKRSIYILVVSGILIALFVVVLNNLNNVKDFISNLLNVLLPFIWGILFAIITNRPANFVENHLPKNWKANTRRFIGSLCAVLLLLIIVSLVFALLVPKLIESISSISSLISNFTNNSNSWISDIQKNIHLSDDVMNTIYSYLSDVINGLWTMLKNIIPSAISSTINVLSSLGNFLIGFIVCLYILIDKDKIANNIRRVALAILPKDKYEIGKKIMYLTLDKFNGFFGGKIYDSTIVGILCFIAMLFINKEYAALIAVIVGITDIIPIFGPFIGAVPCAILLLIVEPIDCLLFALTILVIQQIDGNIISPAILGDSVGLSSLWIMFAIIVGGAYFGFFGMLLGVPAVATIYYAIKEFVDERLKEKGVE